VSGFVKAPDGRYHRDGCVRAPADATGVTRKAAVEAGLRPCLECRPHVTVGQDVVTEPGARRTLADGRAYPWARAVDGTWHLRPDDDTWQNGDVNCVGVCGATFGADQVETYRPDVDVQHTDLGRIPTMPTLCPTCQEAAA
jgi:hypothetical protein